MHSLALYMHLELAVAEQARARGHAVAVEGEAAAPDLGARGHHRAGQVHTASIHIDSGSQVPEAEAIVQGALQKGTIQRTWV